MNKTTSIRLDRELHKKMKIYCILHNTTISKLVTKVLQKELKNKWAVKIIKRILK